MTAFVLTDAKVASHDKGSLLCRAGWCSNSGGTPVPYTHADCGGTVHGDLLDQHTEPASWSILLGCDKCKVKVEATQFPHEEFEHGLPPAGLQVSEPALTEPAKKAHKAAKR